MFCRVFGIYFTNLLCSFQFFRACKVLSHNAVSNMLISKVGNMYAKFSISQLIHPFQAQGGDGAANPNEDIALDLFVTWRLLVNFRILFSNLKFSKDILIYIFQNYIWTQEISFSGLCIKVYRFRIRTG